MGMDADVHTNEPRTSPRLSYLSRLLSSTMSDKRASYAEYGQHAYLFASQLHLVNDTLCCRAYTSCAAMLFESQDTILLSSLS
jgi:hypothetical protein